MLVENVFVAPDNHAGTAVRTRSFLPPAIANNLFLGGTLAITSDRYWFTPMLTSFTVNNIIATAPSSFDFTPRIHPSNVIARDINDLRLARLPSDGGDGWGDDPATPDIDESANDDLGDLRLTAGSIAIDAGDALAAGEFDLDGPLYDRFKPEPVLGPTDAAGAPRFVDDPATPDRFDSGTLAAVDAGPFEYQPAQAVLDCPADMDRNGTLDGADFVAWITTAQAQRAQPRPTEFIAWLHAFNAGC